MEGELDAEPSGPAMVMPTAVSDASRRHYFQVLVVTPNASARAANVVQQMRLLRRPQDEFIYEPVVVGSFEDAVLAVMLNPKLQSFEQWLAANAKRVPIG